jgi:hypothetical protein
MNTADISRPIWMNRLTGGALLMLLLFTGVLARAWTSADGTKTFTGELQS